MKRRRAKGIRPSLAGEALVAMMVAAGSLIRDLDSACQEFGVTHDQYNVLRILRGAHPGGHPRGEIANRLISRSPDVTRMLDRLVKRGLARRSWDAANRRLSIATITDQGLDLLGKVDRMIVREHGRYTQGVSDKELSTLRRLCQRMIP